MIDAFAAGLTANACRVVGPFSLDEARATIVKRVPPGAFVAADDDVPVPGLASALRDLGVAVLTPGDAQWNARLPDATVGITGSCVAVTHPAAFALASAPGSPRGTSLLPPAHICVVRAADVMATFEEAVAQLAARELPSALTWISGPSRTGDLEMVTTLGVHGPRTVEVVLLH